MYALRFWWWTYPQMEKRGGIAGRVMLGLQTLKLLFSADFMCPQMVESVVLYKLIHRIRIRSMFDILLTWLENRK